MGDPRLNSMHLDSARREDYRRAREAMLRSRGIETLYGERNRDLDEDPSPTVIRLDDLKPNHPTDQPDFWVSDRDFVFPLKVGVNTMGRSSDNDVLVEDLYVSRRHCAIMVHHDGACILHDTASKNGTFLNGMKISGPTPLRPGDEICICSKHYIFNSRHSGPVAAPNVTRTIVS